MFEGPIKAPGLPILEAVIEEDGTVRDVRMLKPVHPCIDRVTMEALRKWRFRPAMYRGKPVPAIFNMTVHINWR